MLKKPISFLSCKFIEHLLGHIKQPHDGWIFVAERG